MGGLERVFGGVELVEHGAIRAASRTYCETLMPCASAARAIAV